MGCTLVSGVHHGNGATGCKYMCGEKHVRKDIMQVLTPRASGVFGEENRSEKRTGIMPRVTRNKKRISLHKTKFCRGGRKS